MYSVVSILFSIGVCLILAGFLGRFGTDGLFDVSKNVASALGLLITYAILIMSLGSFSELTSFLGNVCGGIPFVKDIADYGSFHDLLSQSPESAAVAFLDTVILSAIIDLIMLLPLGHNQDKVHFWTNKGNFMTNLFVAVIATIAGLLILNYVIKTSNIYHFIVSIIGSIIVFLSVGTIPMVIIALIRKKNMKTLTITGIIGLLFLFSRSKIIGALRAAFFQAIVYVGGIWMLEKYFGNIANGLSVISGIVVAFVPIIIIIIGLLLIVKSVKL